MGVVWYDWQVPVNSKRTKHHDRQRILKLCYKARLNELKYNSKSSNSFLINSVVAVPKEAIYAWVKNSYFFDMYIQTEFGSLNLVPSNIEKIN